MTGAGEVFYTYICDLLVSLQGLYDPSVILPEAELLNPVGEVVVGPVHEAGHVGVGPGYGQHLPSSHVEVTRHLVRDISRTLIGWAATLLPSHWSRAS